MQLTIEVLPAPFGPMMEYSSPSLTPKDTSVSARTPPKRSDTPRTSKALFKRPLRQRDFPRAIYPGVSAHPIRPTAGGPVARGKAPRVHLSPQPGEGAPLHRAENVATPSHTSSHSLRTAALA